LDTFNPAEMQLEAAFLRASSDKIPHVHLKPTPFKKKKKKRENTERAISENFLKVNAPLLQG